MLTLEHLIIRQFGFELNANWSVTSGERIALIGPSGAGKSTLLGAIAGFVLPQQGRILWDNVDQRLVPPGARPLTILFQDQNLFPHLTILQNLGLGVSPNARLTSGQCAQIEIALGRVGLEGLGGRRPGQLSGGQQGRAALARALLRARPILLLDEPFAALGPALKAEMLGLVDEIANANSAAVVMVTHDPNDAIRFADKTVLVANGVAHPPVPTAALFAAPPPELAAYLG